MKSLQRPLEGDEEDSAEDVADIRQALIDYCMRNPVDDDSDN